MVGIKKRKQHVHADPFINLATLPLPSPPPPLPLSILHRGPYCTTHNRLGSLYTDLDSSSYRVSWWLRILMQLLDPLRLLPGGDPHGPWRIVQIQYQFRISNLMYIALDGNSFSKLPLDRFPTDTLINLVAFS